jgi:hypothetical protein
MAVASEADKQVDLNGSAAGALRVSPAFDGSPRGRVLTAMVEVVARGGYREATDVSWSEFIELFEDLDACMLATLEAGLESAAVQAEQAVAACDEDADVGVVFEAALRAVLEAAAARPDLTRLCLVDAPALGGPMLERRQRGLQRFVGVLERQLGSPGPDSRGAPASLAAEMVVGGIYEVVQHKARAGEMRQLPELVDELRQLWLPALRGV